MNAFDEADLAGAGAEMALMGEPFAFPSGRQLNGVYEFDPTDGERNQRWVTFLAADLGVYVPSDMGTLTRIRTGGRYKVLGVVADEDPHTVTWSIEEAS